MTKKRQYLYLGLAAGLAFVAAVMLFNTSSLTRHLPGPPVILAHRGIAQRFDERGVTGKTCTAARMLPPTNAYLENTIASMRAAFVAGADIVELDVHPTTDGHFAVFHDWTLDCRTDGHGVTREHTLGELQALDIGHGYTADGGKTFPFRGKARGLMPSLDEVIGTFPTRRLLINVKSNDPKEGIALAAFLRSLPVNRRRMLMVYGGDRPMAEVAARLPEIRTMSRAALRACGIRYLSYGWTGIVPDACRNLMILLPIDWAPWAWGWPDRFAERMRSVNSEVFIAGPYEGGGFTTGIDDADDLARLPNDYSGGVLTNEVELIAPALKRR